MLIYVLFILFVISSIVILCLLDRLKMIVARNLFIIFMWVMYVFIPITIISKMYVEVEA